MRNNQPVTQRGYTFPDGVTLMSTTDTQSLITYANEAFVDVSGFEPGSALVDQAGSTMSEVVSSIRPVTELNSAIAGDHLLAIGSLEDRMLILLDIEKLMGSADMGLISEPSH